MTTSRRSFLGSVGLVSTGAVMGSLLDPLDSGTAAATDCQTATPTPSCDCSTPTATQAPSPTATPQPIDNTTSVLGCGLPVEDLQPVDWTGNKYASNPVLLPSTGWESDNLAGPFPVVESDRLILYYGGWDGHRWRIGRAVTTDGVTFKRDASNPVFGDGAATTGVPWIVRDGTWHLFYTRPTNPWRIAYANSTDGVSWTDHGGVLEPTEDWNGQYVANPTVVKVAEDDWRMWYWGDYYQHAKIGYATASDALGPWSPHSENPVLSPSGSGFEADSVLKPRVGHNGNQFLMYYSGKAADTYRTKSALASSPDGISWTRHHPDGGYLHLSQDWEQQNPRWDELEELTPVCFNGQLLSYYSAVNAGDMAGVGLTWTEVPQDA